MKWKGRRQSDNVDDRRGRSSKGTVIAGGGTIGYYHFTITTLWRGNRSNDCSCFGTDE